MVMKASFEIEVAPFESLGHYVLRQVRSLILEGKVKPGEILPEVELAELFQVSRGPVRDAINALEREGLVVSEPRRRARVTTLDETDVEEIYSLRKSLETLASERAPKHATTEDIDEMKSILDKMEESLEGGDPILLSHLDTTFHDVIYRASKHKLLYQAWTEIRSQVTFFLIARNREAEYPKEQA